MRAKWEYHTTLHLTVSRLFLCACFLQHLAINSDLFDMVVSHRLPLERDFWLYCVHDASEPCWVRRHSDTNQQLHHLLWPNDYLLQLRERDREEWERGYKDRENDAERQWEGDKDRETGKRKHGRDGDALKMGCRGRWRKWEWTLPSRYVRYCGASCCCCRQKSRDDQKHIHTQWQFYIRPKIGKLPKALHLRGACKFAVILFM